MKLTEANKASLRNAQRSETALTKQRNDLAALADNPELAELERSRIEKLGTIQSNAGQLDLVVAEIKRLESDLEVVKKRIDRDRSLLPTMTNPKDIAGVEHELETLGQRLDALETQELEALEKKDDLDRSLLLYEEELAAVQARILELESQRAAFSADLKAEVQREQQLWNAALGELPDELAILLQKLWSRGSGVGELRDTTCGVCHMGLNSSAMSEIKKTPKDELVQCPECRAILLEPSGD